MQSKTVLAIITEALMLRLDDPRIVGVESSKGVDGQDQLILTTITPTNRNQVWIIDAESILEHDAD